MLPFCSHFIHIKTYPLLWCCTGLTNRSNWCAVWVSFPVSTVLCSTSQWTSSSQTPEFFLSILRVENDMEKSTWCSVCTKEYSFLCYISMTVLYFHNFNKNLSFFFFFLHIHSCFSLIYLLLIIENLDQKVFLHKINFVQGLSEVIMKSKFYNTNKYAKAMIFHFIF
jgi:hypothetical protein